MNTNTTPGEISHKAVVPQDQAGMRLDQIAVDLFPQYSRSRLQTWIKSGELLVNGLGMKQTAKLNGGEELSILSVLTPEGEWLPEELELDVVFEDQHILVINKPAALVVHPAAGNWSGTLLNGLLGHSSVFKTLPRAGIVHRLDKDTSGLMVIAKTLEAQNSLVKQLQARSIKRQYRAISMGGPDKAGTAESFIGRHPGARTKMAVVKSGGKEAVTHYRVKEKLGYFRDLIIELETGRTHQIRVHMAWLGFPLVGDAVYGKKLPEKLDLPEDVRQQLQTFPRQALHAQALALVHPHSGEEVNWRIDLPNDHYTLLRALRQLRSSELSS